MISFEPLPIVTCSSLTLNLRAMVDLSRVALPSGYRCVSLRTASMESNILGLGPIGFSLLASLMALLIPNSLSRSSIGLPGS